MNGEDVVADFIVGTHWGDLPERVQREARMCLLDTLGVILAGTQTIVSEITAEYAAQTWPGDEATLLMHGKKASAVGAAFANGWTANAIDSDDIIRYAGHAGAQVVPTALSLSEGSCMSGDRLLAALVVGYEVAHRVGRCWHDAHDVYQSEGSWGSPSCAAVAAHLMGLGRNETKHALGIAEYHAPNAPMMLDIDYPTMVKHAIGWGAMNGVISAQLAKRGFTGTPSLVGREEYAEWVADIGDNYVMVGGLTRKRKGFACCAWTHGAAEGAKRLVDEEGVDLDDIESIRVETFHSAARLGTRLPNTTEEAQFNMAWPIAAMLLDGEVGPAQTLEHRLDDPHMLSLAQKVKVVETEELNRLSDLFDKGDKRGHWASIVTLVLRDGTKLASGLEDGGFHFPASDWDEERIASKFRWLTLPVLGVDRVDEVVDMVWRFDEVSDVRELTCLVAGD